MTQQPTVQITMTQSYWERCYSGAKV